LPKGFNSLHVGTSLLDNGKLTIIDQTKQPEETFNVPKIRISFENLLVDSTHKGLRRILNTDDIRINLEGISLKTKDVMYTITPGEIALSTRDSSISVSNLLIKPNYPKYDFSRKVGYQIDRMDISIKKLNLEQINLRQLIINRKFIVGTILVDGLVLDDYRDQRLPMRPNFKPLLPQQALLKSKGYINIGKIKMTNGKATYSEQVEVLPGTLFFDKMEVTATNVTNDSIMIKSKTVMKINATMCLMGKGLLNASINIPLGAKKDAFTFSATLSKMDLREVNPMLSKLFPAEITSGEVDKMVIASVQADDDKAKGSMDFYYKNLTIKLDAPKKDTWSSIKAGVITFAANTYVRNCNPSASGAFTPGMIYFERAKRKSLFNFLWKSTFSGIKSTIGVNKKEQKEMKKEMKIVKKKKK
ncbi:MAG: DUF748 domain-containing protein, partial [Bacteroidota bacterium]